MLTWVHKKKSGKHNPLFIEIYLYDMYVCMELAEIGFSFFIFIFYLLAYMSSRIIS